MNRKRKTFEDIFERGHRRRPPPFENSVETTNRLSCQIPSAPITTRIDMRHGARWIGSEFLEGARGPGRTDVHSSTSTSQALHIPTPIRTSQQASENSVASSQVATAPEVPEPDAGMAMMASALLNREVQAQVPNSLDGPELDELTSLVAEAMNTATMEYNDLTEDPFIGIMHHTHIDTLERIRSLTKDTAMRFATLQALSPDSEEHTIQETLAQVERAIDATRLDLKKLARQNNQVRNRVWEVQSLVKDVEEALELWRSRHPDTTPIRIDNSAAAFNPALVRNTPTLIAYVIVLVGRVMEGLSRRSSSFLLKGFRLFGYSLTLLQREGPNLQQQRALRDIPEDIRALESALRLDVKTTVYAVCPRCSCTHLPFFSQSSTTPSYPQNCTYRSTCLADICNEPLLDDDNMPFKTFEFYSFLDWFGRFLALPGIAKYSDAFCKQVSEEGPPLDKSETADGRFFYELKGSDGKLFIQERGKEGRWFFKLHADFFNVEGNRIGGKHNSTGVISMTCLNLPLEMREDPAYIYLSGVIQGHEEPNAKEVEHNHYSRPLVDELVIAYNRGIQCAVLDAQESPYDVTHRVVLALISMDFKASRPFAGLLDVQSHNYCFICKSWHRAYHGSVNYEEWEPIDDDYLRAGAEMWRDARNEEDRKTPERFYGVRFTEFWRLPYWRPSRQVAVDAMHTMYLILQKNFFRDALRLDNPNSTKDPKNKTTTPESSIAHEYKFTPPPPLSLVSSTSRSMSTDESVLAEEEDEYLVTSTLQWDHLSADVRNLRLQRITHLQDIIRSDPRLIQELSSVHNQLSSPRPSTTSTQAQLGSRLKSKKWAVLLYVCNDLMVFPAQKLPLLQGKTLITKSDLTKDDMVEALLDWRLNSIQDRESFVWPHFTPTNSAPPTASWAAPILTMTGHETTHRILGDADREMFMRELIGTMNYKSAVGVGHIHQHLWAPLENNGTGKEKLAKNLKQEPRVSLLYVCADLNIIPLISPLKNISKKDLIHQLLDWRLTQPLQAISWTPVDSPRVLERVHQALREVTVPGWVDRPAATIGLPKAGTPTADNWRILFSIFLPLALLSLWKEDSPIAASDAYQMCSVLETSMYLTCAENSMAQHNSKFQDRENFRAYLRRHVIGLKANFPGFILSSHHLAFHIFECMDLFGSVHNSWCFPGERLVGRLRRIPVNHKIGEFEGTLLHSFCKGSAFRRWVLRPDCPPLLRYLRHLLDKAYSLANATSGESEKQRLDSSEATQDTVKTIQSQTIIDEFQHFKTSTPRELLSLLRSNHHRVQCYTRIPTPSGNYYGISTSMGKGSSYVCFYPGGDQTLEWVPGQIQHIFRENGRIKFAMRRSLPKMFDGGTDPFQAFWAQGFQAKSVSSLYSNELEIIDYDWVLGHTARWELRNHNWVVCLNLKNSEGSEGLDANQLTQNGQLLH